MAASAVILITSPVRTPAAETSRIVPEVAIDAIFATFVVVCSESTSIEYPPALRSESMNSPLPASFLTFNAVVPVAEVCSLTTSKRFRVEASFTSDLRYINVPSVNASASI